MTSKLIILHNNIGAMIDNIADNVDNSLNNETQKSNSGENVYACSYCGAKFNQSIDYVRHIRLKHLTKLRTRPMLKCREGPPGGARGCVLACVSLDVGCVLVCVLVCVSVCALCVSLDFLLACFGCLYLICLVKSMDCVNSVSQCGHMCFFSVLTLLTVPY